jgi:hypothetical protein
MRRRRPPLPFRQPVAACEVPTPRSARPASAACYLMKLDGLFPSAALTLLLLSVGSGKDPEDSKKGPAPGVSLANAATTAPIREKQESATPLPEELVAAWTQAGAEVGWTNWSGFVVFRAGVEGKKGEVPAFRLSEWREGVVGKLPQPRQAFGLFSVGAPQPTCDGRPGGGTPDSPWPAPRTLGPAHLSAFGPAWRMRLSLTSWSRRWTKSPTGMAPRSPSTLSRTATVPAVCSFSPTTSM